MLLLLLSQSLLVNGQLLRVKQWGCGVVAAGVGTPAEAVGRTQGLGRGQPASSGRRGVSRLDLNPSTTFDKNSSLAPSYLLVHLMGLGKACTVFVVASGRSPAPRHYAPAHVRALVTDRATSFAPWTGHHYHRSECG